MGSKVENITPYGTGGDRRAKSTQVREMFDSIAPSYDLMNRMMTLGGLDRRWRRKCVDLVASRRPTDVLDLATGTGDLAVSLAKAIPDAQITGGDLSEGMLQVGRMKIDRLGLSVRVSLRVADALNLPFPDDSFDAITIGFGVRNFEHLDRGYAEMTRVLRPGGLLVVLELTPPASKVVKPFYNFYTRRIIPAVGRIVSRDSRAYTYLPESIAAVPARDDMTALMKGVGLTDTRWKSLAFGAATIYTAIKPS